MSKGTDFEQHLQYRILGLLHSGGLRAGDRLPSIRQIAREEGVDHRAVARAYRVLEHQGIVEVRPGSGVYVAGQQPAGDLPSGTGAWLADLLQEGWRRRLPRARLGELIARCSSLGLRCACVESNRDHLVALAAELEEDFSLQVQPVLVSPYPGVGSLAAAEIAGVDVVVATVFHSDVARAAAASAGKPFVPLTYDREFTTEIDRRLQAGPVTAVMVDPEFAVRGRAYFAVTSYRDRVRYVLAHHLEKEGVDPTDPAVLVTRAARRLLGLDDYHLLPPPFRVISPESAHALCCTIVTNALGTGLERASGAGGSAAP